MQNPRCTIIIRSAWPLALKGDEQALVTTKAARKTGAKPRAATVCTQSPQARNRISNKFARRLLGTDGYNLARISTTGDTLGHVAAIVTWQGTALLWTVCFVLDSFLEFDLALGWQSWALFTTISEKLPAPWSDTASRICAEFEPPKQARALHGASCSRRPSQIQRAGHVSTGATHVRCSDTSGFQTVLENDGSSGAGYVGVAGARDDETATTEFVEAKDLREEQQHNKEPTEHWVWDNREQRYHLSGRLKTDFGYWYPDPNSFA